MILQGTVQRQELDAQEKEDIVAAINDRRSDRDQVHLRLALLWSLIAKGWIPANRIDPLGEDEEEGDREIQITMDFQDVARQLNLLP